MVIVRESDLERNPRCLLPPGIISNLRGLGRKGLLGVIHKICPPITAMSNFEQRYEHYGTASETNPLQDNAMFDVKPEGGVS
jgi:hypothetical protein